MRNFGLRFLLIGFLAFGLGSTGALFMHVWAANHQAPSAAFHETVDSSQAHG